MKAEDKLLIQFLEGKKVFSIPVYQREYVWTKKECKKLLDDIIEISKKPDVESMHFIGSIVFSEHKGGEQNYPELSLIDGQQRITTITLLYAALCKKAEEYGDNDSVEDIRDNYLNNKHAKLNENKLKLKPTDNNQDALNWVLGKFDESPSDVVKETQLYQNYQFFLNEINENNRQTIYDGLARLGLVAMEIQKWDNEQRIFESLNATGVDLSQGDLIRNYVLQGLDRNRQESVFKDYWLPIQENTKDENEKKSKVSEFFLRFLQYQKQTKDVKERSVFETFKEFLKEKSNQNIDIFKVLQELKLYSEGFYYFINPQKYLSSEQVRQHLTYIKKLKFAVAYPFMMRVYVDLRHEKIDETIFVGVLEILQSYQFRRFIADGEVGKFPSNRLLDVMVKLYKSSSLETVNKENYLSAIEKTLVKHNFPDDKQIEEALRKKNLYASQQDEHRRYLFERLGRHIDNEGNIDYSNVTTEHVFPETPNENWNNGNHILTPDERQEMIDLQHHLGNLTPLSHTKNSGLGNKDFLEKRDHEKGYKKSNFPLTRQLGELSVWDKVALEKRTAELTKLFLQVWKRPDIMLSNEEIHGLTNIQDVEQLQKGEVFEPIHAEWCGTVLEFNSFADLYYQVILESLNKFPDIFDSNLKSALSIVKDKSFLPGYRKTVKELPDGTLLTTNSNSDSTIKLLKKLDKAINNAGHSAPLRSSYRIKNNETNETTEDKYYLIK